MKIIFYYQNKTDIKPAFERDIFLNKNDKN